MFCSSADSADDAVFTAASEALATLEAILLKGAEEEKEMGGGIVKANDKNAVTVGFDNRLSGLTSRNVSSPLNDNAVVSPEGVAAEAASISSALSRRLPPRENGNDAGKNEIDEGGVRQQPPVELFNSVTSLCNFYHNTLCSQFLVETVAARLEGYNRRLIRLQQVVNGPLFRARSNVVTPTTATKREGTVHTRGPVQDEADGNSTSVCRLVNSSPPALFTLSPLLVSAAERCKAQKACLQHSLSERSFGLLPTQRFALRLEAFISHRLAPLQHAMFVEPLHFLHKSEQAAKARQQAFLSRLSRSLHEAREAVEGARGGSRELAAFVQSSLEHNRPAEDHHHHHHQHHAGVRRDRHQTATPSAEASGAAGDEWSGSLANAVLAKLRSELQLT